jgi:peptide/nickel transport system permease protein
VEFWLSPGNLVSGAITLTLKGRVNYFALPVYTVFTGGRVLKEYFIKRILGMIPTLIAISILVFILIQLPPGDLLTSRIEQLTRQGYAFNQEQIEALKARYGLDKPLYLQYFKWITRFIQGDMGYSFSEEESVKKLITDRLGFTVVIALLSMLFTWVVALPIGIYSAVKQYSKGDYFFTVIGFLGLATPNFMLALILMYTGYKYFGFSVGGLFSPQYVTAPWSWDKFIDLLKHLWIPMIVVGTAGTAGMIRIMRANLLDELEKPYVITARAKGVSSIKLLLKYPVRIALNPFISTIGWMLPQLFSGSVITAVVLSLPTIGPLLLTSLLNQDMYLAGAIILILSVLTVIGTLLSDLLLALIDPRIKYE